MPPKKPLPPDKGGVPKPARTGAITGDTPVKEHIRKIEKNESKEAPKLTGAQKVKGKVVRKPPIKANRRLPVLQEVVEDKAWDWETPQNHSTPKGENARKEATEAMENGGGEKTTIHTPVLFV